MTEQKSNCSGENHQDHICSLRAMGKSAEIECLTSSPTVECGVCGAKANSPENVCTPAKVWEEGQIS